MKVGTCLIVSSVAACQIDAVPLKLQGWNSRSVDRCPPAQAAGKVALFVNAWTGTPSAKAMKSVLDWSHSHGQAKVAIIYYSVAGGPFGTEDVISAAGGTVE